MSIAIRPIFQLEIPDDPVAEAAGWMTSSRHNEGSEMTTDTQGFVGRSDAGEGPVTLLTPAQARALLELVPGLAGGNVPVLDGSGKLPTSILPGLAITTPFEVGSQAAMLALDAQQGDIAIRTDLSKTFVLATNSPSTLADWKELRTPTDVVLAVAGLTGTITAAALKAALAMTAADIADLSANGRSLITAADYAAMRVLLGLVVGTNVQAASALLASIAALTLTGKAGQSVVVNAGANGFDLATAGGGTVVRETITVSGNFTKAADDKAYYVECIGAGASGNISNQTPAMGMGGLPGEVCSQFFDAASLPATVPVVIGAGGASVVGNGNAISGLNGGDTSFGSYLTAKGGLGVPANTSGRVQYGRGFQQFVAVANMPQLDQIGNQGLICLSSNLTTLASSTYSGGPTAGGNYVSGSGGPLPVLNSSGYGKGGAAGLSANGSDGGDPGGGGGATGPTSSAAIKSGKGGRGEIRIWRFKGA